MQLPVKAHYATLAMLALAQVYEGQITLPAKTIARDHEIPNQFLVQILQQLRAAGLVSSTRGSGGGFRLEKPPSETSVGEIVEAVCPLTTCATGLQTVSPFSPIVRDVWVELDRQQRHILMQLSLAELLERQEASMQGSMFYI